MAMNWNQAYKHLLNGRTIARKDWKASSRISANKNSKFILLSSTNGGKPWSPYFEDFGAEDWYVMIDNDEDIKWPDKSEANTNGDMFPEEERMNEKAELIFKAHEDAGFLPKMQRAMDSVISGHRNKTREEVSGHPWAGEPKNHVPAGLLDRFFK